MEQKKHGESLGLSHKEWRRVAKRERRRRLRKKAAEERDDDAERLKAALERTAEYTRWIEDEKRAEKEREIAEKREHDEREKIWLEREARAQKEFRIQQEQREKQAWKKMQEEELIRKEFEAKQAALKVKKEESRQRREEEMREREETQRRIDEYIDNGGETPEFLRETYDSQAGKELCPFFMKTGACRYGDVCSRNHRRIGLSKVILLPGFYTHFSLEKNSAEYDTDVCLEFERSEMQQHYREFYESVVPELETFGRIRTLKCCCNTEIHLRGNVYVEYGTEREAARAWRKLRGRYYAQRQLNCEFVSLTSWRNAICGIAKCPKGRACNFLHTFRNPNDAYGVKSSSPPKRWKRSEEGADENRRKNPQWDFEDAWEEASKSREESRNWRWSETPERQLVADGTRGAGRQEEDCKQCWSRCSSHKRRASGSQQRVSRKKRKRNEESKNEKEEEKKDGRRSRHAKKSDNSKSKCVSKAKKRRESDENVDANSNASKKNCTQETKTEDASLRNKEWDTTDSDE